MKTAITLALLLLPIALAEVPAPQWEEFCPRDYCNAQARDVREYHSGRHAVLSLATMGLSAPFAHASHNREAKDYEHNYWARRHMAFNSEIAACQQSEGDKATCYMQVRHLELEQSIAHANSINAELARQQSARNAAVMAPKPTVQQQPSIIPHQVHTHCTTLGGQTNCTSY